jgi:hypothetical protein
MTLAQLLTLLHEHTRAHRPPGRPAAQPGSPLELAALAAMPMGRR